MDVPITDSPPDDLSWPSDEEAATMTMQDWQQFYARQRYREHDATLLALQAAATAIHPSGTALCSIRGHAHGYTLQFTLVQFEGPSFRWYEWEATTKRLCDPQAVNLNLDLGVEFHRLRHEPIILRREGNRNIDRTRGVEGRVATMFLVVGQEAEWIEFPSPLHGGIYPNTAINRIYREMMGMQQSITLVDESEIPHP
jgi:hypothetical protein